MVMDFVGLRPERDRTGEVKQRIKTEDSTSCERGRPTSTNSKLLKNKFKKGNILSLVPDGFLVLRRTGRMTVCRNMTLILTPTAWVFLGFLCVQVNYDVFSKLQFAIASFSCFLRLKLNTIKLHLCQSH
jgi:hypothetical protein